MHGDCTAEHLQARRDGGRDTRENIVATHRLCNSRRHQLFPVEAPEPMAYAILIMLAELAGIDLEDLAQTRPRRISTGPMPS
nr:HNH endonuclease [Variovorax boronicumulans]